MLRSQLCILLSSIICTSTSTSLLSLAVVSSSTNSAYAQTRRSVQVCNDWWIDSAMNEVAGRFPTSGECNINRYGGGQWSSYRDLTNKVRTSFYCNDPWIGQAWFEITGRDIGDRGTSGVCNIMLYGGGQWSSYPDLVQKVRLYMAGPRLIR